MIRDNLIVLLLLIGLPPGFPACQVAIDRGGQAEATGDGENLAGGVGRGVAGKITDCFRNFLRQTDSTKGDMPQE